MNWQVPVLKSQIYKQLMFDNELLTSSFQLLFQIEMTVVLEFFASASIAS